MPLDDRVLLAHVQGVRRDVSPSRDSHATFRNAVFALIAAHEARAQGTSIKLLDYQTIVPRKWVSHRR
jgi:hypothetical protein